MKAKAFFLSALLFAGLPAGSAPARPLTVAVYDFNGYDEARSTAGTVTTLVTADLATETNLILVERMELNQALNEQAFDNSGMVSPEAAAKIGQVTGAKVLVAGEVMKIDNGQLVLVANITSTETGRLFAEKVQGSPDKLVDLTSELGRKIAQTINEQTASLTITTPESGAEHLEHIIKSITGTNRPAVLVNIHAPPGRSPPSITPIDELGRILLKAGFPVVDKNSDRKPDVIISGVNDLSEGPRHGDLYSFQAVIELKIQSRQTGYIIGYDRQESTATDATRMGANRAAQADAIDALAERILPALAK